MSDTERPPREHYERMRHALADFAYSNDMTLATAQNKARRIYESTPDTDAWAKSAAPEPRECEHLWVTDGINPTGCQRRGAPAAAPAPDALDALITVIKDYNQADDDGVMVLVSRQACDEAAAALTAMRGEIARANTERDEWKERAPHWNDPLGAASLSVHEAKSWRERAETLELKLAQSSSAWTAMNELQAKEWRRAEAAEAALLDANEMCRSAYAVAERDGRETAWLALRHSLKQSLDRQHAVLAPIRAAKDAAK